MLEEIRNKDDRFMIGGGYKSLKHGYEAKAEVSLHPRIENIKADVEKLINIDNLEELLEKSKQKEEEIYNEVYQVMQKWLEQAKVTSLYMAALKYKNTNITRKHTYNEWISDNDNFYKYYGKISNEVYKMKYYIYETTSYNYNKNEDETVYYVTWGIWIQGLNAKKIAGQDRKRYTDIEKAFKYIEGRKKAYSDLFKEIRPSIPKEYAHLFMVNGILLPEYKIAE